MPGSRASGPRGKAPRRESAIQAAIVRRFEREGWFVVKIGLCNRPGFPDLMMLRDGRAVFVEVKRPGERPRPLQQYRIDHLRKMGFEAAVLTE